MADATAERASRPMDPWIVEALREDLLKRGAEELGIDVAALEIVLTEVGVKVDIQICYLCASHLVKRFAN